MLAILRNAAGALSDLVEIGESGPFGRSSPDGSEEAELGASPLKEGAKKEAKKESKKEPKEAEQEVPKTEKTEDNTDKKAKVRKKKRRIAAEERSQRRRSKRQRASWARERALNAGRTGKRRNQSGVKPWNQEAVGRHTEKIEDRGHVPENKIVIEHQREEKRGRKSRTGKSETTRISLGSNRSPLEGPQADITDQYQPGARDLQSLGENLRREGTTKTGIATRTGITTTTGLHWGRYPDTRAKRWKDMLTSSAGWTSGSGGKTSAGSNGPKGHRESRGPPCGQTQPNQRQLPDEVPKHKSERKPTREDE